MMYAPILVFTPQDLWGPSMPGTRSASQLASQAPHASTTAYAEALGPGMAIAVLGRPQKFWPVYPRHK